MRKRLLVFLLSLLALSRALSPVSKSMIVLLGPLNGPRLDKMASVSTRCLLSMKGVKL